MPWWIRTIFMALVAAFLVGLALGLWFAWWRRQQRADESDRYRLADSADTERLLVRIRALEAEEDKATRLAGELATFKRRAASSLLGLESSLIEARARAAEADELERRLGDLEAELVDLRARAARVEELEAEMERSDARVATMERLEAELEAARTEAEVSLELRSRIQSLEAELVSVGAEASEVDSLRSDLDQARADTSEARRLAVDVDRLSADLGSTRADNGQLLAEVESLRDELATCRRQLQVGPSPTAVADAPAAVDEPTPARPEEVDEVDEAPAGPAGWVDDGSWRQGETVVGTAGADHRDDLQAIRGIGPKLERTLNELGIRAWEQLATLTDAEAATLAAAIKAFPKRIERDDWIGSARSLLASGRHDPRPDEGAAADAS